MSSLEQVIFADTRAIVTLLNARDTAGLDALLMSGQRVMISRNVLDEIQAAPETLKSRNGDTPFPRMEGFGRARKFFAPGLSSRAAARVLSIRRRW